MLTIVMASQQSLGTFEQGESIRLIQTCTTCPFVTLDTIKLPNGTILEIGQNMTQTGNTFYYDFEVTDLDGEYIYNTYYGNYSVPVGFLVTLNGNTPAEGITVVVFSIIFILIVFFGIIYFLKSLAHFLEFDMDLIDAAVLIATYLAMWIFYYFSTEYLGNSFINSILEIAIDIGAISHVLLPIIGFMISFIMTNLKAKKKARTTY